MLQDLRQPVRPEVTRDASFVVAWQLWVESWQAAIAALTTARRDRLLSTKEAAVHTAAIAAERQVVTNQLTRLLEGQPARGMNGGRRS